MCSNYQPVTDVQRLLTYFGAERAPELDPSPAEVWPLNLAPFIRLHEPGSGNRVVENAVFGMLPPFAKEIAYGRRTYNARSETVHVLPTYKKPWEDGMRCIIPAEAIFEPCYESGKAVRWRIEQAGAVPMGIAGIYRPWRAPDGRRLWTMSMLTVDAEGHPVFARMHKPGDDKRMVVILHPDDHDAWLTCPVAQAPSFFKAWTGPLLAVPDPLPARAGRPGSLPPHDPQTGELF